MRAFIILIEIIYLWIPGVEQIPQSSIKAHKEAIKYVFWLNLFENKISMIKSDSLSLNRRLNFSPDFKI